MATLGNADVLLQPQSPCSPTWSGSHASVEDSALTSQAGKGMQTLFTCSPMANASRATLGCPRDLRGKHAQVHFPSEQDAVTLLGRVGKLGARKKSKSPVAYLSPIREEDDFSFPSGTGALHRESWASKPHGMAATSKSSESLREHVHTPRKKGVSREDTKSCECQGSTAAGTQLPTASELPSGETSWLVSELLARMTIGQVGELVSSITRPELVTSSIHNASTAELQLDTGAATPEKKMQNLSCGIHSPRGIAAKLRPGSRAVTPDRRLQNLSCGIRSPRDAAEPQLGSGAVTPERRTQNLSCGIGSPRNAAEPQLGSGAVTPDRRTQNLSDGIPSRRSTGTRPRPCWK